MTNMILGNLTKQSTIKGMLDFLHSTEDEEVFLSDGSEVFAAAATNHVVMRCNTSDGASHAATTLNRLVMFLTKLPDGPPTDHVDIDIDEPESVQDIPLVPAAAAIAAIRSFAPKPPAPEGWEFRGGPHSRPPWDKTRSGPVEITAESRPELATTKPTGDMTANQWLDHKHEVHQDYSVGGVGTVTGEQTTELAYAVFAARRDGTTPKLCKAHGDWFIYEVDEAIELAKELSVAGPHEVREVHVVVGNVVAASIDKTN